MQNNYYNKFNIFSSMVIVGLKIDIEKKEDKK
jgi:hypothetical protein